MQGASNAGAVVITKGADALGDVIQVGGGDDLGAEDHLGVGEARLGLPPQVHDDLEQLVPALHGSPGGVPDRRRQGAEKEVELSVPVLVLGHQPRTTAPNTGAIAFSFFGTRTRAATLTLSSRTSRSWPASASKPASCSTRVVRVS